jgi:HSP20 family protein
MNDRQLSVFPDINAMTGYVPSPLPSFRREMDRMFDDFFAPARQRSFSPAVGVVWPSVDLQETDQAYMMTAELPGMQMGDVHLKLRDNALTMSGEKRQQHAEGKEGRCYTERTYGRFERTIPFHAEIDADHVEARFKDGVLTVDLPKNPKARNQTRSIEIKPQA